MARRPKLSQIILIKIQKKNALCISKKNNTRLLKLRESLSDQLNQW